MSTDFPDDRVTVRIAARDQHTIRHAAKKAGQTVQAYLETLIAIHADEDLEMPPFRWEPPRVPTRPKRTLQQVREEQRATSPDGMSTYTRELTIIRNTTKENA